MLRYLAILFIFLLYLFPCYQTHFAPLPARWENLAVTSQAEGQSGDNERPFFSANFVNQESPGIINHAPSMTVLSNNRIMCAWYAGSREGAKDVAIYYAVFNDQKDHWTEPSLLMDREQSSKELNRYIKKLGNALIFSDNEGSIWFFYSSLPFGGWSLSTLNYKVSIDYGKTWNKSKKLILSPFFNLTNNVKNKGINLSDNSFILPVYHEFIKKLSQLVLFQPKDTGFYYEIRKMTNERKAIQPTILHQGEKKLVAFFRNMIRPGKRCILMAKSDDLGQTWSRTTETCLPNPNSGFDMVKLTKGEYLGVVNDSFDDRSVLVLVMSRDEGNTWKTLKILEKNAGKEYSYPFIIKERQFYHVAYTFERRRIKHIAFNEAWINQLSN